MGDSRMKTILELCREVSDILGVERPNDLLDNSENNRLWLNISNKTLLDLNNRDLKINVKDETL